MKRQSLIVKLFALFSVVRGYNLIVLALAQSLASLSIFAPERHHLDILRDFNFIGIIFASVLSVAAGYIINNFYDLEKDEITRPLRVYIGKLISQKFKLYVYLILNFIALTIALFISWKILLFFFIYQILVWFYSHKVNRLYYLKNIYLVIIRVLPFFALMLYYDNYALIIFSHATYLILLLLITDLLKDLTTITADIIFKYSSIPVKYGKKTTKHIISVCILLTIIMAVYLSRNSAIGYMSYFFIGSIFFLFISLYFIWRCRTKTDYKIMHLLYKGIILVGVISIAFIQINPLDLQNIVLL